MSNWPCRERTCCSWCDLVLVALLVALAWFGNAVSDAHGAERDYQDAWCEQFDGGVEFTLLDRVRVDCMLDDYAIEFDFAHKWAESVGQSLLYASRTDRRPGIVLIMRGKKDCKYLDRLREVLAFGNLGITVWETGEWAYKCHP